MAVEKTLSKSQYVKGLKCPLSLWFYRAASNDNKSSSKKEKKPRRIDPALEARFAMGDKVGELAKAYFDGGVEVVADYWDTEEAQKQTQDFVADGAEVIYEATAINPEDGTYASIDVLRKVEGTDEWDMIEVKSSTRVKPYHYDDITFQKHVFEGAGYKIRDCYVMFVDNEYVRDGEIDPQKYFKMQDVDRGIGNRQEAFKPNLDRLLNIVESPEPPDNDRNRKCSPRSCECADKCWGEVPLYSIFNVYSGGEAFDVAREAGSYDIQDIPEKLKPGYQPKRIELEAHLSGEEQVSKKKLKGFLKDIEYPVYFLDYETVSSGLPLYDGTRPYEQVPFQFSLHIQEEPGGPLVHKSFLHKKDDDPRKDFIKKLVKECGDKGSVIVYYKPFEAGRNDDLAEAFPRYADKLAAINERMVDLYEPFKERWLYNPEQNGSASLKAVLPAFTDISYDDMEIGNGEQALQEYMAFVNGETSDPEEIATLWEGLEKYCELDTYAMVRLLEVMHEKAGNAIEPAPLPPAIKGPKP